MPLDNEWIDRALFITGDFETQGDPWTAVTGDFDRMGISCGPQQVNIGQGSLQPLVIGCGEAAVRKAMPEFGAGMWRAANESIVAGLGIVRGWQSGSRLNKAAELEIKALLDTAPMRAGMRKRAEKNAAEALRLAENWDGGKTSLPTFCWFFDLVTQNGGLKGLDRAEVEAFKRQHGSQRVDDLICDQLDDRPIQSGHDRDAHKNAALWRDPADPRALDLLVLSHLRAGLAKAEFRHVVMNRKGTLAMRRGWVNGELYEFK